MATLPNHLMPLPVGREPLPRQVVLDHQRRRILEAAIEVFAKRGYPATTVDHIVAASRSSVGRFYSLFEGKEDCFLQAFELIVDEGREQIEADLPAAGSPTERALAVLAAVLELIATAPLRARVALVEAQTAGPSALALYQATLDGLVPELRRCREESPIGAELPETLEVATLGGAVWFLQQRIVLGEIGEAAALLPELAEIVIEPYLGREQTELLLASAPAPA